MISVRNITFALIAIFVAVFGLSVINISPALAYDYGNYSSSPSYNYGNYSSSPSYNYGNYNSTPSYNYGNYSSSPSYNYGTYSSFPSYNYGNYSSSPSYDYGSYSSFPSTKYDYGSYSATPFDYGSYNSKPFDYGSYNSQPWGSYSDFTDYYGTTKYVYDSFSWGSYNNVDWGSYADFNAYYFPSYAYPVGTSKSTGAGKSASKTQPVGTAKSASDVKPIVVKAPSVTKTAPIGEAKTSATAVAIAEVQPIGEVASYYTAQPVGYTTDNSINNSYNVNIAGSFNTHTAYITNVGASYPAPQYATAVLPPAYYYYPPTYVTPVSYPFISLRQIPYTGFDGGLALNIAYWVGIVSFSLAAGYLAVYYIPAFFRIKKAIPEQMVEAPIKLARSVATSIASAPREAHAMTSAIVKDSMSVAYAADGAPRLVITRG